MKFDNNFGNSDLRGFAEIGLPDPVSYFPQTVGWYGVFILLLAGFGWFSYRLWCRWRKNRYRRIALKRLVKIEQQLPTEGKCRESVIRQLPVLVKETALQVYPRADIAQLSGQAWLTFLDDRYGNRDFTQGVGQLLNTLSYRSPEVLGQLSLLQLKELITLIRQWIREHNA